MVRFVAAAVIAHSRRQVVAVAAAPFYIGWSFFDSHPPLALLLLIHTMRSEITTFQRMIDPRRKNYDMAVRYCKYCGCAHGPNFERLQDKCRSQHGGIVDVKSWTMGIDDTIEELQVIPMDPATKEQSARARQAPPTQHPRQHAHSATAPEAQ